MCCSCCIHNGARTCDSRSGLELCAMASWGSWCSGFGVWHLQIHTLHSNASWLHAVNGDSGMANCGTMATSGAASSQHCQVCQREAHPLLAITAVCMHFQESKKQNPLWNLSSQAKFIYSTSLGHAVHIYSSWCEFMVKASPDDKTIL